MLISIIRSIISNTNQDMHLTQMELSNSATISMRRTINLAVLFICILGVKLADLVDSQTCRPAVRTSVELYYFFFGGVSNSRFTVIQILMQATNGLGVILENRYYGQSYPFPNSTVDNLRFLTTEQTIADNAYFAQHATFPGVNATSSLNAPNVPWILYGGSLAGAQTAFSVKTYPNLLYGGIGSSATTHAVLGYPEW